MDVPPLIVRPGGMGDLIVAMIALENIDQEPRDFHWLIEKRSEGWARHHGLTYWCYDRQPTRLLVTRLGGYSRVINTEQLYGLAQAFSLASLTSTGVLTSFETSRENHRSHRVCPYDQNKHEVINFERLFRLALDRGEVSRKSPKLRLRKVAADAPWLIGIAGLGEPARRWSIEQWVEFTRMHVPPGPLNVVAAPVDRPFAQELVKKLGKHSRNLDLSFDQLCGHMARASRLLTHDGGLCHMASYFGVPVTVGFTSGSPVKWHPLSKGSLVLAPGHLPCHPCTRFGRPDPCKRSYACKPVEGLQPINPMRKNEIEH